MAKNKKVVEKIKKYLEDGPRTTSDIYDHINNTTKMGITKNCLNNILPKNPLFTKSGHSRVNSGLSTYDQCVWELE